MIAGVTTAMPFLSPERLATWARRNSPPKINTPIQPDCAMPFVVKPYVSEATRFIQSLKVQNPALEAEQKQGRALLWDKPQDAQLREAFDAAAVPQKPYVYGSE